MAPILNPATWSLPAFLDFFARNLDLTAKGLPIPETNFPCSHCLCIPFSNNHQENNKIALCWR